VGSLTALLLVAAGIYLVVRSLAAADAVLSPAVGPRASSPGVGTSPAAEAKARDDALRDVGTPPRDPFHVPERPAAATSRLDARSRSDTPPEVRLVLFDQVDPEVQLSSEGGISGRLRVGQSFEGWTITAISQSAVVVMKDGITHTLTLRRQP
jgi:hypothetical protein